MDFHSLTALSPLDGRYQHKVASLSAYFSELALIQARTEVEIEWFLLLSQTDSFSALP
ncbi:MAG TPA: adenylosuccinate lyase, partial [Gammaproteobacteria bacterium]|nr:adenylosuccinate lyase [Gammaproteobacteria bacterium]